MFHRGQKPLFSLIGGLLTLFLFFAVQIFSQNIDSNSYPDPKNYIPNFWFDTKEKYYPTDPLKFYYDQNFNEISGYDAVAKYNQLTPENKLRNFVIFYDIKNSGDELVYQYWAFYVMNDAENDHFGDWEFVQVYINRIDGVVKTILASAHTGTTTKVFLSHGEVLEPEFNHATILVEEGSHANCIDTNMDGLFEKKDHANWYNSYCSFGFRDWSSEDQKNGVKILHDSPYYKLVPLSELRDKLGTKYSTDKPLISKEKSPSLGMIPLRTPFGVTIPKLGITSSKFYALKVGGDPPQNAWQKPEYFDPEKASPITVAKVTSAVQTKVSSAVGKVTNVAAGLFSKIKTVARQTFDIGKQVATVAIDLFKSAGQLALVNLNNTFGGVNKFAGNFQAGLYPNLPKNPVISRPKATTNVPKKSNISAPSSPKIIQKINQASSQESVNNPQVASISSASTIKEKIYTGGGPFVSSDTVQNDAQSDQQSNSPPQQNFSFAAGGGGYSSDNGSGQGQSPQDQSSQDQPPQDQPSGGPSPEESSPPDSLPDSSSQEEPPADTIPPDTILDNSPPGLTNQQEARFEFHSTEEPASFECSSGQENLEWQACVSSVAFANLSDGDHTIKIRAIDEAGNIDPTPIEFSWTVDTVAPTAFLRLSDDYSPINPDFAIVWGLENPEEESSLDYFDLEFSQDKGNTWNAVELTEEEIKNRKKSFTTLEDEATYYIRIRTTDILGNTSGWQELAVDINTHAVVVNEIGYRGTHASHYDEWVELFNTSNHDISLAGWTLAVGQTGTYNIELEGIIPANGYYLMERDVASRESDNVISDIPADLLYQGAITDNRIRMWLVALDGNLVDEVYKFTSFNGEERISLERVSPYVSGADPFNWLPNNGITINGSDAEGNPVAGTPKAQNSVYLLYTSLALVPSISTNATFLKERSPYIVYDTLTVEEGVTLTMEPGVIVHFAASYSRLIVNGTLISRGTQNDEIVYTSIRDDEYRGTGGAQPGLWKWIAFTPTSRGSIFEYSRIRYAGSYIIGFRSDNEGIIVNGTDLVFRKSVFERVLIKGFHVISSRLTIEGSKFLDNNSQYDTTALIIEGESDVSISNSEFRANTIGIEIRTADDVSIADSTFIQNSDPIRAFDGGYPTFSGENIFSGNGLNGVSISGKVTKDLTWHAGLTYIVISSVEVDEGVVLTIEPGTFVKFPASYSALIISGTIIAQGEESRPIVFTSLADDDYGGDAQSNGETHGVPGQWKWIIVNDPTGNSILEHVIIRYAGNYNIGFRSDNGALLLAGGAITVRNLLLEHNLLYGLRIFGCACVVEDSVFQYQNSAGDSIAIEINGGSPVIRNSRLINNSWGIWVKDGTPILENLYFEGNTVNTIP